MRSIGLLALLLCACATQEERLADPAHSVEEVAERAVSALSRGDHEGLLRLLVRQAEYRRLVFPALPASAPEGGLDPGFAWENMQLGSLRDLGRAERAWEERGRPSLQLVSVQAAGVERHRGLRLHGPLTVLVRTGAAAPEELRLLGHVVERDGQFKLLAYHR